jgi:hypothetical protein
MMNNFINTITFEFLLFFNIFQFQNSFSYQFYPHIL